MSHSGLDVCRPTPIRPRSTCANPRLPCGHAKLPHGAVRGRTWRRFGLGRAARDLSDLSEVPGSVGADLAKAAGTVIGRPSPLMNPDHRRGEPCPPVDRCGTWRRAVADRRGAPGIPPPATVREAATPWNQPRPLRGALPARLGRPPAVPGRSRAGRRLRMPPCPQRPARE